jgi:hypothetical protein
MAFFWLIGLEGRHSSTSPTSRVMNPVCDLVLRLKPDGLICGFVGDAEKERLNAAGIDVRLGSCSRPIDELYAEFDNLSPA